MSDTPDYTAAGEVYRKSMEEALANIDKLSQDLLLQREKVIDEQHLARDIKKQIERDAHKISQDYIDQHRNEFEDRLKSEILRDVVKKLILAEVPSVKLKQALELSPELLTEAWMDIGFEKLNDQHIAHVGYESYEKSGSVIFFREDIILRFSYKFGVGLTLAIINIPTSELWEQETGIPEDQRKTILEFVAARVLRDQATGYHYRFTENTIVIELEGLILI